MSIQKLRQMIESGKTFNYRGQQAIIKDFSTMHDEITVMVEVDGIRQDFIKESEAKLELFLACFVEITDTAVAKVENKPSGVQAKTKEVKLPLIYSETKETFKSLTEMLLKDIEKVREKPEYVGQAKQVCNNVSAIVNITKLQLQLLQEG